MGEQDAITKKGNTFAVVNPFGRRTSPHDHRRPAGECEEQGERQLAL